MKNIQDKFEQLDGKLLAKLERGQLSVNKDKWLEFILPIQIIAFLTLIAWEIKILIS